VIVMEGAAERRQFDGLLDAVKHRIKTMSA